jgi:hypothetical protein
MGQLRFVTPDRQRLPPGAVEQAYLTGMEAVPFPSRNFWDGEQLVVERTVRESGNFHILWNVPQRGPLLLSTASLMERQRAYLLPVELARGTLNRLRNQQAMWEAMGLSRPADYFRLDRAAMSHLAKAATQQANPLAAAAEAENSLAASLAALDLLGSAYIEQVLSLRHQQMPQLSALLGCALPSQNLTETGGKIFQNAFNCAAVGFNWREIEATSGELQWANVDRQFQWLQDRPLKVCAGPLLRLNRLALPDWIYLWEDDFEAVQGHIYQYVNAAVERYRGQVQVWHCAAGLNLPGELSLSEEQKLRLAVLAIDAVRRGDPRTPVVISFDQPWGEYLQREELDLPPYHFADALVRADLGVSGIALELNLNYSPGGTLPRDLLELSRLVERWSTLGVPLLALLTAPSTSGVDPFARAKTNVLSAPTPAAAALALKPQLEMLMAKQAIHGVIWNQFADREPHTWPHSGLFDAAGQAKPLLSVLSDLRKEHLA